MLRVSRFALLLLLMPLHDIHALAMQPVLVTPETMQEFDLHYRVDLPEYDPDRAVMRLILERKGGFSEASSAFVEMRTGEKPLNVIVSIPVVIKIDKTTLEIRLSFDPRVGASGWYLRIPKTETPKQLDVMNFLIPLKPHLHVISDKDSQGP